MTVGELIKELQEIPEELEVYLQKDSEGNGYSPLAGSDSSCLYVAESSYSGEVYDIDSEAEYHCLEEDEWEEMKRDNPRCVVLFPMN